MSRGQNEFKSKTSVGNLLQQGVRRSATDSNPRFHGSYIAPALLRRGATETLQYVTVRSTAWRRGFQPRQQSAITKPFPSALPVTY